MGTEIALNYPDMSTLYFAPSKHEVPKAFEDKTEIFGMGEKCAKALAAQLNRKPHFKCAIIFGCAGGLHPERKIGETLIISKIVQGNKVTTLSLPPWTSNFPKGRLTTSSSFVGSSKNKRKLYEQTWADLVDMEMAHFWEELHPELKEKVLMIRGVVDTARDNFTFIKGTRLSWLKLINPIQVWRLLKFIRNLRLYHSQMNDSLGSISILLNPTSQNLLRKEAGLVETHPESI